MSPTEPLATLTLSSDTAGARLDVLAADLLSLWLPSRTRARKEIKAGRLLLDGQTVEPFTPVSAGQVLTLLSPPPPTRPALDIPIPVIYADDHLAAVLKPAGLLTNGNRPRTLDRALPSVLPSSPQPDALPSPRVVHRLDRPTSGLVLVARTRRAQVALGWQLERRELNKHYRAIVRGRLEGSGRIVSPIDEREAITEWRAQEHTPSLKRGWLTTLDLHPLTGRTHQLRRHLASIGHPILGDAQYAPDDRLKGKGLFLFAAALTLVHPITGESLTIAAAEPSKYDALRRRETRRHARVSGNPRTPDAPPSLEEATP